MKRKWELSSTVALAVFSLAVSGQAQIGRTLAECEQNYGYGKVFLNKDAYTFCGPKTDSRSGVRYFIFAIFVDGRVSQITYYPNTPATDKMYTEEAGYWLKNNAPEIIWSEPAKNKEETEMAWTGSVNGELKYFARLQGTLSLKIIDQATNVGGVIGAKREIANGQSVTVLPQQGTEYEANQKVVSTPARLSRESAEADLNRAWRSLTPQQRDQLSKEERHWIRHKDSLPAEEQIKSTADRAKYIWSFVERTFDD